MSDKSLEDRSQPSSPSQNIPLEDIDMYLPPSRRKKSKWRKFFRILLSIIVLAAIAFAVYWFLLKPANAAPVTPVPTKPHTATQSIDAKPVHYESSNFGVSFNYPKTWQISDKEARLTVTSPLAELVGAGNNKYHGKLVMTIQPKDSVPAPLAKNNAVAVLESKEISYDNPSGIQTADTYISYLQYANTIIRGGLDAVYVTGGFGYEYGQTVPTVDVKKLDPIITVTFESCSNKACSKPTPLTISSQSWQKSEPQKVVQKLLASIRITE